MRGASRTILAALLLLALGGPVGAETLTWDQAVAEALGKNPSLASSREQVEAAKDAVTSASSGLWPSLNASGSLNRSGSQALNTAWGPLGNEYDSSSYQFGLNASWRLFDGFATWSSRAQAEFALTERQMSYRQASRDLRQSLRQNFNLLLYQQQNIELLKQIKDRLNQDTRFQEIQFQSGRTARWTFLKAEADEAQIAWQISQASQDLLTQQRSLARLLGRRVRDAGEITAQGALDTPAPPDKVEAFYDRLAQDHPDLLLQKAALRASEAAINQSLASRYPSLSANGGYNYSDGSAWPPTQSSWSAGLSLSYNLFSGFGPEAAISQATRNWMASRDALDDLVNSLESQLYQAWASYRSNYAHMAVYDLQDKASEERFKTVQPLYEGGRTSYLDFEQAEADLTQDQQTLLSGALNLAQAAAGFDRALGLTLEDIGTPNK